MFPAHRQVGTAVRLSYRHPPFDRWLRICSQPHRSFHLSLSLPLFPFSFYIGKDRTGLVVALTLAVLGVSDEAIVDDYAKSDAAYKELADRDAMVGALSQVRT